MKRRSLKSHILRWFRTFTEHILTMTIWAVWFWSASRAGPDWETILFKVPTLPLALEIGAAMCVVLLVTLWIRAYYSLELTRPMPLQFELDPQAEQKCLAMVGWDAEKQALARKTQCFSVSTGREDLKCKISVP